MFPPGRAKLKTIPRSIGTRAATKTMGIVLVVRFAATTAHVTIASTLRRTTSRNASSRFSCTLLAGAQDVLSGVQLGECIENALDDGGFLHALARAVVGCFRVFLVKTQHVRVET